MTGVCLWAGTLSGHSLWTRLRAAGIAGYASLSVAPIELLAVCNAGAERRLATELAAHELTLSCLDPVATWLPGAVAAHPAHRAHASIPARRCLELAERFHIGLINLIDVTWQALPAAAAEHLADFAALARQRGAAIVVEAQLYSGIPDVPTAVSLCRAAGSPTQLMIDAWHLLRPDAHRPYDLGGCQIGALQLADGRAGPCPDPVAESIGARLLPGRGAFGLAALRDLAAAAPASLVGPEVFGPAIPEAETVRVASDALHATRAVLHGLARSGSLTTR